MAAQKQKLAVIGEGISALSVLERLGNDAKLRSKVELLWFAAPDLAPGCSYQSTALITDHGIKASEGGIGPELVHALELTRNWEFLQRAPGVYHTTHWAIDDSSDSFVRRYGEGHSLCEHFLFERPLPCRKAPAMLLDVSVFLPALKAHVEKLWGTSPKRELVFDYKESTLTTNKAEYSVERVIWASGASVPAITKPQSFQEHPKACLLKRVEGFAYYYKVPEWSEYSFAMSVGHVNLLARAGHVFLGGTTQNQSARIPEAQELAIQLSKLKQAGLDLQVLEKLVPAFWGGPRQKGSKRQALIAPLSEREFSVQGTYKNGFTLAQLGALRVKEWLSN